MLIEKSLNFSFIFYLRSHFIMINKASICFNSKIYAKNTNPGPKNYSPRPQIGRISLSRGPASTFMLLSTNNNCLPMIHSHSPSAKRKSILRSAKPLNSFRSDTNLKITAKKINLNLKYRNSGN